MASAFFSRALILVRGGGDLASGVIYRLYRAGFPVIVTELETPILVRRAVSYGAAVYTGEMAVEGVMARRARDAQDARQLLALGCIPVLVDAEGACLRTLEPPIIVDARMAKINLGTQQHDAPLVVALGPGFTAGLDCHAVIETNRGHNLGRALYTGAAEPDTGEPGIVDGKTHSRVLRAPAPGYVRPEAAIGDFIQPGQVIAWVSGQALTAPFAGVLRGLIHERVFVQSGMKIGDLDPRAKREHCFTISDKSLAIGGGVLEAVLSAPQIRSFLMQASHETA
jgi:xanthine dehydrogenase accessory factor